MAREIQVSILRNWGRPKKEELKLPAFLLPKGEREKLLHYKKYVRGRPKGKLIKQLDNFHREVIRKSKSFSRSECKG